MEIEKENIPDANEQSGGKTEFKEPVDFDISAFTENPTTKPDNAKMDDGGSDRGEEEFTWGDYKEEPEKNDNDGEAEKAAAEKLETERLEKENLDGGPKDRPDNNNGGDPDSEDDGEAEKRSLNNDDAFKAVAKELGLEANSADELRDTLKALEEENSQLRNQKGGVSNDTTKRLNSLKEKSDEELYRLELKQQGFNDDDVQEQVDISIDNNTLRFEGKKIRNQIDGAIGREEQKAIQSNQEAQATQEQERVDSVNELSKHINGQDKMFGFNMAKDEATLQKTRDNHLKYITSGDYLNDITANSENLAQSAWLWKHRKALMKGVGNAEFNKGKKEILDDLGTPDISDKSRFKDPGGSDEFDPAIFMAAPKKR